MKVKASASSLDFRNCTIFDFLRYIREKGEYLRDDRLLVVDLLR